jgi:hypothetical protein
VENKAMKWGIALAWVLWLAPALALAQAGQLDRVVKEQIAVDEAARASQERINQLDDETQRLLSEYRRALADAESYTIYAKQLAAQVDSQNEEMNAMQPQLVEVETPSREVAPLMERMLETLEQFVALDVPFLVEERAKRVAGLKDLMARADVTNSEKYRRILEAYQIELDYGRTLEAYEGKLGDGGRAHRAVPARRTRGSLYQTLDGRRPATGTRAKTWVVDDEYGTASRRIAVARKTRAPEMLILPCRAEGAKSEALAALALARARDLRDPCIRRRASTSCSNRPHHAPAKAGERPARRRSSPTQNRRSLPKPCASATPPRRAARSSPRRSTRTRPGSPSSRSA